MTQPPTWGTPPPPQLGGWPNHPQSSQPGFGGQWGPPPQPSSAPAPVPPKKGGAGKWVIGAVALVAVIAVTVVITVTFMKSSSTGSGGGRSGGTTSAAPSDVASANDTGPVGIITEDPSCAPWGPIQSLLAGASHNGWAERNQSLPASAFTPEMRAQYEAVGKASRKAADQAAPLAKMTTHRVMRELYEQFIAYSRAYADSVSNLSTYRPADDNLAQASAAAANVLGYICGSVSSGAAAARASLVPPPAAPKSVAPIGDLSNPQRMFATPDGVCKNLKPTLDQLLQNADFKNWAKTDPNIPVSAWSPELESLTTVVIAVMSSTADALQNLAQRSSNPMVQDFIMLGGSVPADIYRGIGDLPTQGLKHLPGRSVRSWTRPSRVRCPIWIATARNARADNPPPGQSAAASV